MEDRHRKILQTSYTFLTKNIHDVEKVCDYLVGEEVLTSGMMDTIKHKTPKPTAQVRELLNILPRRGKKAYESFVDALIQSENQDAADHLRTKEGSKGNNSKKQEEAPKVIQNEDWPSTKGISIIQRKEIQKTTDENLTKISESKKVYHMTGENKGKVIVISNVPDESLLKTCQDVCKDQSDCLKTTECEDDCLTSYRRSVDYDKTSIQDLFKHMKFESKVKLENQTGEEMKDSLRKELQVDKDDDYSSAVIVVMSGGMKYEAGQIYDKECNKVPRDDILQVIREAEAFKGKPKIVIIRTYSFEETTKSLDSLDADKVTSIFNGNPNQDDMFVVTSIPKTEQSPWIVGESPCGSYFIQALIDVFKNQAHDKSFLDLMEKVNNRLHNALVPETVSGEKKYNKKHVAEVVVLEHCNNKELYLFPCQFDKPEISVKGQVEDTAQKPVKETKVIVEEKQSPSNETKVGESESIPMEWPDLKKPGSNFRTKDLKKSDHKIYSQIMQKGKEIYSMTGKDKGKFILISNVYCPPICYPSDSEQTEQHEKEDRRRSLCRSNIDFDNTYIVSVLKAIGWKNPPQIKNKTKTEIMDSLKGQLDEIDEDKETSYDSLVVVILSGKIDCEPAKIYDIGGNNVPKDEIYHIIKESSHFKEKPKMVFIQTYNFQEVSPYDEMDAVSTEMKQINDPNSDDLFVVSSYPKIEQGPWMIGENMHGSYFIQGLIHVLTNHAYDKSFMELMKELQKCLVNTTVPEMKDGKYTDKKNHMHVADVALLEHSTQKELYLLPGYIQEIPKHLAVGGADFSSSIRGNPVCVPSS